MFHDLDIVKVNKYSLGETHIEVWDRMRHVPYIFEFQSSTPLQGVTTLGPLGLEVDSNNRNPQTHGTTPTSRSKELFWELKWNLEETPFGLDAFPLQLVYAGFS